MNESPKSHPTREQIVVAMKTSPPGAHYIWNWQDEDDQPLTSDALKTGLLAARAHGRPTGSGQKEQVAIRFNHDVLAAFRAGGAGWQTRMNDALREWFKTHKPKAS